VSGNGAEHIGAAKALLRTAKTAEELRQLLPLTQGFSMQQTRRDRAICGATCSMRTRFLAVHAGHLATASSKGELRNHASVPLHEEAKAGCGWISVPLTGIKKGSEAPFKGLTDVSGSL